MCNIIGLKFLTFMYIMYIEIYFKKYIESFLEPKPSTSEQSKVSTKIQLSQKSKTLTLNEESDETEVIEKNEEAEIIEKHDKAKITIKTNKGTLLS